MANMLDKSKGLVFGLLNHLGDGKHWLSFYATYMRLLNHLGDGKHWAFQLRSGLDLLNHLGDGKQKFACYG